jgi:hypothetical protein
MKPLFIISCPIDTYSGYGARSRDIVKSIIELDKYTVQILPQRWGNTPWNFIEDHIEEWGFLSPYLLPVGNQLPKQPDIWAQITVPNEFQPVGKYNIGFTAGIETTICAHQWIEGMNRMNMNFVSSEHSKKVFETSTFQKMDQNQNVVGEIKLEKPCEVLFEGVNLDIYKPKKSKFDLSTIEEDFAFLFVGHWLQGELGEDRKNIGVLIKSFLEAFKNKKKTPALILKTSGAGTSYIDRQTMLLKIDSVRKTIENARTLPNVYLLHGEFSDPEINELYNHKKVKALVSATKGEGFGRPLLEFTQTKKPILTTNWSGHLDFLSPEFTSLVGGEMRNVHPSAAVKDMLIPESQWFNINGGELAYYYRDIFENYKGYKEKATRQAFKCKTEFSLDKMKSKLDSYLDNCLPEFPKQVALKLPKIKKIELPKVKKLENV